MGAPASWNLGALRSTARKTAVDPKNATTIASSTGGAKNVCVNTSGVLPFSPRDRPPFAAPVAHWPRPFCLQIVCAWTHSLSVKYSSPMFFFDILYITSILRHVYCYTVMSTARSGVRGTQRSERPANVAYRILYTLVY